jgi:hypothetical protein
MHRWVTAGPSRGVLTQWRYRITAACFLAILTTLIILAGGSPASASVLQGVLVYGKDSLFLVNTGQADIDLNLLVFVRDHPKSPARFSARDWAVPPLKTGQCVQLRARNVNVPVPQGCRRLVRWLLRKQPNVLFWQSVAGGTGFRVVAGSADIAACDPAAGQCAFRVDSNFRVENLTLTYTQDTLWITNTALTPTSLANLHLCRAANGPICLLPFKWRPADIDQMLDPGGCIELNLAKTPPTHQPCSVASSSKPPTAFWLQSYYVISPITAYTTICPAARRRGIQRCVVPR